MGVGLRLGLGAGLGLELGLELGLGLWFGPGDGAGTAVGACAGAGVGAGARAELTGERMRHGMPSAAWPAAARGPRSWLSPPGLRSSPAARGLSSSLAVERGRSRGLEG